jgi:[acyl-carrier-protein] S-malonyltransferase
MQAAVAPGKGAMAALLGVEMALAQEICEAAAQGDVIGCANDNGGGQVVVSGTKAAVERAIEIAKSKGVKRAMLLPVSAPFHCALMEPAAEVMEKALEASPPVAPMVPLIANVTAAKVTDPAEITKLLVEQVTGTVRWRESVEAMVGFGVDRFVELGSGKVLAGLAKRIAPDAGALSTGSPADIEALLKVL